MAILREGFRYNVKFVKKRETKAGTVTDFVISDRLDSVWVNIRCTTFADLDLKDGDRVKVTRIGSFEIDWYKGKIYYNAIVDVEPVESSDAVEIPFDI